MSNNLSDQEFLALIEDSETFKKLKKSASEQIIKRLLALSEDKKQKAKDVLLEEKRVLEELEKKEQERLNKMVSDYLIKIQGIKSKFQKQVRVAQEKEDLASSEEKEEDLLKKLGDN